MLFPWTLQNCLENWTSPPPKKKIIPKSNNNTNNYDTQFLLEEGSDWWGWLVGWQASSQQLRLASPLTNQWTGTGCVGTPSAPMASPAKNVQVVAPHAGGRLVKSAASTGVTQNPSKPFHNQGMFHCLYLILALECSLHNRKAWFTDCWQYCSVRRDTQWNVMFFHWDGLSTQTFAELHLSMAWPVWQYDGVENLQTKVYCCQQIGDKIMGCSVGLLFI